MINLLIAWCVSIPILLIIHYGICRLRDRADRKQLEGFEVDATGRPE